MTTQEVFESYFRRSYENIQSLLILMRKEGLTTALWGAGVRGRAFLNVYDLEQKYIDIVYDLDEKKIDTHLPTGHVIKDYRTTEVDVILLSNWNYEEETIRFMKELGRETQVISLDSMVLGILSAEEVLHPQPVDLSPVRQIKVCALVIAYHPDDTIFENIQTYLEDVDHLYFYDNTEEPSEHIKESALQLPRTDFISHHENKGLGAPINEVAELATDYDWIITFDQDSQATPGMITQMRLFANSRFCDDRVGLVVPVVDDSVHDEMMNDSSSEFEYIYRAIQSGMLINKYVMQAIGGFWEELFIDYVDTEYCYRNYVNGYKMVRINKAVLIHQVGQTDRIVVINGMKVFKNKLTPMRIYHITRNSLWIRNRYLELFPIAALEMEQVEDYLDAVLSVDEDGDEKKRMIELAKRDCIENANHSAVK